jgi:RimJ/RimL family protein N-acetyltransferase
MSPFAISMVTIGFVFAMCKFLSKKVVPPVHIQYAHATRYFIDMNKKSQIGGVMLKKIYIIREADKQYEGYGEFCAELAKSGVEVCEVTCDDLYAEVREIFSGNLNAEVCKASCANLADALIISWTDDLRYLKTDNFPKSNPNNEFLTDDLNKTSNFPLVGLGEDYRGNAKFVIYDFNVSVDYIRLIYDRLHGFPHVIATTERLILREMTVADLPAMYGLYDTLADCGYIEKLYDYEKEREFTENYIKNMYGFFQYGLWLVFERKSGELIGRVGLENREIDGETRQELGYLIRADRQRRGLAYEACRACIDYATRELDITELFACIQTTNTPSANLARKLGFTLYAENVEGMDVFCRRF